MDKINNDELRKAVGGLHVDGDKYVLDGCEAFRQGSIVYYVRVSQTCYSLSDTVRCLKIDALNPAASEEVEIVFADLLRMERIR